ncbi:MAG: CRISPR-associated endonuclease Cas2 [Chromatiaceae bacterium]|nr:CRISPR-associated endonuclease Cas2 [Chromatiaceae bacterium]
MPERLAVFAYDISNDRTRRHSLRSLREWRLDGQLSVHECVLDERTARALFAQLADDLDPATDSLLFGWVQRHRAVLARGKGRADPLGAGLVIAA